LKALFVGLGSVGQRHLRNLLTIIPEAEIMAVRSTRSVPLLSGTNQVLSSNTIRDKYNVDEFESLSEALNKKPNLIFITNPTSFHLEIAFEALKSGAFVFIEKPLSNDWNGVDKLINAENTIGEKRIALGYQYRFHPALKLVKKSIVECRIGKVVGARLVNGEYMPGWHPYEDYRQSYASRRELGGGAILTQIHDFDYAMLLFGEPKKVFSVGGHLSDLEVDVEDSVQILMECKNPMNNFPVSISLDYLQWPPVRSISVTGDKGSIECDLTNSMLTIFDREHDEVEHHKYPNFNRNDLFIEELKNFLAFAQGKELPMVDLEQGTRSLKISLAAFESMETGVVKSISK
jgi:predicted dehydrogenase